ncbi:hypothetical protein PAMP_002626 [Pampus punctatissimus]
MEEEDEEEENKKFEEEECGWFEVEGSFRKREGWREEEEPQSAQSTDPIRAKPSRATACVCASIHAPPPSSSSTTTTTTAAAAAATITLFCGNGAVTNLTVLN